MAGGASVVGGVRGRSSVHGGGACMAGGHAWQGACVAGGVRGGGGVRILLECILVI